MPKRKKPEDFEEIRRRADYRSRESTFLSLLQHGWKEFLLAPSWEKWQRAPVHGMEDFFLIRAVTLIEVFARRWIAHLIEHGEPYRSRGSKLLRDGDRIDYALVSAIRDRRLTLGDLVAHSISLNSIEDVHSHFSTLLGPGADLWNLMKEGQAQLRKWAKGKEVPALADLTGTRRSLSLLFQLRHIVVHESPLDRPYDIAQIPTLLSAATSFCELAEPTFMSLVSPYFHMTHLEYEAALGKEMTDARAVLEAVVGAMRAKSHIKREHIDESQAAWEEHSRRQATLRASTVEGGSLYHGLYVREHIRLIKARCEELQVMLDLREGEI